MEDLSTPNLAPSEKNLWNWIDILLILIGIGAIFALGLILLGPILNISEVNSEGEAAITLGQSLSLALLEAVAIVGGVYFLGMRRHNLDWKSVGLTPLSTRWLVAGIVISAIVIPLSGLIALLIMLALGQPLENPQLGFLIPEGFSWLGAIGMVAFGGLAVPFAEELFFRGVLYVWLKGRWGVWLAVLLSSAIFGIVHVDLSVGGAAFVLGIILALAYEYSNSLWTSIMIHAVNNSVKIIILYALVASGMNLGL